MHIHPLSWTNVPSYSLKSSDSDKHLKALESHADSTKSLRSKWVKMRHWAGMKWKRMRHQNKSLSSGQLCQWNDHDSISLIYSPASALQPFFAWSVVCSFWRWGTRSENDASPSAVRQQNLHEQRIQLWWWTFSSHSGFKSFARRWITALPPSLHSICMLVNLFSQSLCN